MTDYSHQYTPAEIAELAKQIPLDYDGPIPPLPERHSSFTCACQTCPHSLGGVPLIVAQLEMTRHARRHRDHAVSVYTASGRYVTGWNPERHGTQLTLDDVPPF